MIPISPDFVVRPLDKEDIPELLTLLNPILANTPYSTTLDEETARIQILGESPPTVYPVRWQEHRAIGVWRAKHLVGLLDAAIGFDSESLDLPDYHPLGLLRFLILTTREDLIEGATTALFTEAERYWREAGVRCVKAFHISTGYPAFQIGVGILPANWSKHFHLLTVAGYHTSQRYHGLCRPLDRMIEEVYPVAHLSMVYRRYDSDYRYEIYHRRIDKVGSARFLSIVPETAHEQALVISARELNRRQIDRESNDIIEQLRVGCLLDLYVDPEWRGHDIGKLLLRRLLNDATLQENHQMLVYLAQGKDVAWSLLAQHGFQELNYRGYSFEKVLT